VTVNFGPNSALATGTFCTFSFGWSRNYRLQSVYSVQFTGLWLVMLDRKFQRGMNNCQCAISVNSISEQNDNIIRQARLYSFKNADLLLLRLQWIDWHFWLWFFDVVIRLSSWLRLCKTQPQIFIKTSTKTSTSHRRDSEISPTIILWTGAFRKHTKYTQASGKSSQNSYPFSILLQTSGDVSIVTISTATSPSWCVCPEQIGTSGSGSETLSLDSDVDWDCPKKQPQILIKTSS